ncbi:MAG: TraR/DksA family transcriptional regulator [Paracoccaceae bacterium]
MKLDDPTREHYERLIRDRIAEIEATEAATADARQAAEVDLDQDQPDPVERMDDVQAVERARAHSHRRQVELQRLSDALERLAAGTYGICEVSGEPIAPERLEADPAATRSIDHASD